MKAWKRMRFRRKLVFSYLTVFLIAVLLIVVYTDSVSRRAIYNSNFGTVRGMAEKAAGNFDRKIEQYNQILMQSVYNKGLQSVYKNDFSSVYRLYRKLIDVYQPYFSALVANSADELDSVCLYSNRGLQKNQFLNSINAIRGESWFEEAFTRRGILWRVESDTLFATMRVDATDTLPRSEPLGILYLALDSSVIFNRHVSINWPSYRLMLMDEDGAQLLTYASEVAGAGDFVDFPVRSAALGWTLVFSVPRDTLATGERVAFPANLPIIAIASGLLLALILLFTHSLMHGLAQLGRGIAQVNEGRLDVRVESDAEDEIGTLIQTFNRMLDTIRHLLDRNRENERRLSSLEAQALRAQINPHFLYNTLSFINWKCMRAGQDDVSEVIGELSTFYRTCLNKGRNLTHVRTEIANITAYINIQLRMHDNGFAVRYAIPDELLECKMLSFVLQPLVENAILHGLDKRREGGGELDIRLQREGDRLIFAVLDNGPGLSDEMERQMNEAGGPQTGYGVRNVRDRIVLSYGSEYGVRAENRPEGGCAVLLTLPVLMDEGKSDES